MEKKQITIVTHNGSFHADDVFAVAALRLVLESNHDIEVIRTRDQEIIDKADYVVDAGLVYEPEKNCFDHHQPGKAGQRENGIPYSSFGLVWKKYGDEIAGGEEEAHIIEELLVLPIDARDNGVEIVLQRNPVVIPYELRDVIEAFRPTMSEVGPGAYDKNFTRAVLFAKELLSREIMIAKDRVQSNISMERAYVEAEDKRLIILDKPYRWKKFAVGKPDILLLVMPNKNDGWGVHTALAQYASYQSRIYLPKAWAGLSGGELEKVTRVPGSVFCHNNLFTAKAKTKEAAIALAELALTEAGQ